MKQTMTARRVILHGCGGYMGQVLTRLINDRDDMTVVAGVDKMPPEHADYPVFAAMDQCDVAADVVIDFSHPSALMPLLEYGKTRQIPLAIATTGLSNDDLAAIDEVSKEIAIFQSGSILLGINLLRKLLKQTAQLLGDDFDVEIVERHHNRKVDAPSGTALLLADAVNDGMAETKRYQLGRAGTDAKRQKDEIGIHAIRGGTIVGDHSIIFAGNDEVIEFHHSAISRAAFASGTLKAAQFLMDAPAGRYDMDDVL